MEEKLIYKGIIFDLVQKDVEIKNKTYKRDIISINYLFFHLIIAQKNTPKSVS